jgi:hypothetical protein
MGGTTIRAKRNVILKYWHIAVGKKIILGEKGRKGNVIFPMIYVRRGPCLSPWKINFFCYILNLLESYDSGNGMLPQKAEHLLKWFVVEGILDLIAVAEQRNVPVPEVFRNLHRFSQLQ